MSPEGGATAGPELGTQGAGAPPPTQLQGRGAPAGTGCSLPHPGACPGSGDLGIPLREGGSGTNEESASQIRSCYQTTGDLCQLFSGCPRRRYSPMGGSGPLPRKGSPGPASRAPVDGAQSSEVKGAHRAPTSSQAQAERGAGPHSWESLSSPTLPLGQERGPEIPQAGPCQPRGGHRELPLPHVGRGVPRARTLGAGLGPHVRVARAPVVWSRRKLTGLWLPCHPPPARPPAALGARSTLAPRRGRGVRWRRSPSARAEASGDPWRPHVAVPPPDSPAAPGPAQPGRWSPTS